MSIETVPCDKVDILSACVWQTEDEVTDGGTRTRAALLVATGTTSVRVDHASAQCRHHRLDVFRRVCLRSSDRARSSFPTGTR